MMVSGWPAARGALPAVSESRLAESQLIRTTFQSEIQLGIYVQHKDNS